MIKNILICGVGGQGTVLAAKVLAQAAILDGQNVLSAETIGMAQRGGCVTSHVRICDRNQEIFSPLISQGQADILIAFDASEAVRNLSFLKKDGTVVVNEQIVPPTTASLTGKVFNKNDYLSFLKNQVKNVISVDAAQVCKELKSSKIVNMILLGAASKTGLVSKEDLKSALKVLVKPEFYELNVKAIDWN